MKNGFLFTDDRPANSESLSFAVAEFLGGDGGDFVCGRDSLANLCKVDSHVTIINVLATRYFFVFSKRYIAFNSSPKD